LATIDYESRHRSISISIKGPTPHVYVSLTRWPFLSFQTRIRGWFIVAVGSLSVNLLVLAYLVVYHNFHIRGSTWEVNAAWTLPVSSLFGIASFVGFGVLLWPIYGWGTPVVEAVLTMGGLMFTYFMPSTGIVSAKRD
jgi:hypothetical protein